MSCNASTIDYTA